MSQAAYIYDEFFEGVHFQPDIVWLITSPTFEELTIRSLSIMLS